MCVVVRCCWLLLWFVVVGCVLLFVGCRVLVVVCLLLFVNCCLFDVVCLLLFVVARHCMCVVCLCCCLFVGVMCPSLCIVRWPLLVGCWLSLRCFWRVLFDVCVFFVVCCCWLL